MISLKSQRHIVLSTAVSFMIIVFGLLILAATGPTLEQLLYHARWIGGIGGFFFGGNLGLVYMVEAPKKWGWNVKKLLFFPSTSLLFGVLAVPVSNQLFQVLNDLFVLSVLLPWFIGGAISFGFVTPIMIYAGHWFRQKQQEGPSS